MKNISKLIALIITALIFNTSVLSQKTTYEIKYVKVFKNNEMAGSESLPDGKKKFIFDIENKKISELSVDSRDYYFKIVETKDPDEDTKAYRVQSQNKNGTVEMIFIVNSFYKTIKWITKEGTYILYNYK